MLFWTLVDYIVGCGSGGGDACGAAAGGGADAGVGAGRGARLGARFGAQWISDPRNGFVFLFLILFFENLELTG